MTFDQEPIGMHRNTCAKGQVPDDVMDCIENVEDLLNETFSEFSG